MTEYFLVILIVLELRRVLLDSRPAKIYRSIMGQSYSTKLHLGKQGELCTTGVHIFQISYDLYRIIFVPLEISGTHSGTHRT